MSDGASSLLRLTIDLEAVAQNHLSLQKKVGRGVDVAPAVKADAYGLGLAPIAKTLYQNNARHFYVTHPAEGAALRALLPDPNVHIYMLHGMIDGGAEDALHHRLTPVLNGFSDVEEWAGAAKRLGKKLPVVLHLDTGMNRLGLGAGEVEKLSRNSDLLSALDLRYVMSHLACADLPDHPKNKEQLEKFKAARARLNLPSPASFANSGGIFLGADYHFDQVRPGAALYGIHFTEHGKGTMRPVVSLAARILQIRTIDNKESLGYGATYSVARPSKIATVSVGYADGYLRALSGRGHLFVKGIKCQVLGRVSMDCIMIDVTDMPETPKVGDWAEIMGPHQTADDVAAAAGTIGYEILTALGARAERYYKGQE